MEPVAIVTGGSSGDGRAVARGLASRRWAIVVVYLDDQRTVEAAVVDILESGGTIVAVRADLADALDVRRLFAESRAAFGGVDVIAHTTTETGSLLLARAAEEVRAGGVIVVVPADGELAPEVARRLRERGVSVGRASPQEVLAFLDRWRPRV